MQHCPKCRVNIRGEKTGCPLCGGRLTGEPEPGGFPVLEKRRFSHMSAVKVATFAFLSFLIIMLALEILYNFKLTWVPFVLLIAAIAWADLMVGIYYRNNFIKTFTYETYLIMATCLLIDGMTGWRGWSVAFVLPIGYVLLIFVTVIVGLAAKLRLEEYIIYLVVTMLLSVLQIIPILLHRNPVILPAVLSMTILLILCCAAVIFRFRDLQSAAEKLFNI
ncbi:MAG TPA: hypothetical protein DCF49_07870 [Lachnospiraceae bacterium]|nr:hypothetical protein [Lachnospiraceae bacterium]